MRKYKTLLFVFFILVLFTFSACTSKTQVSVKQDATGDINKEADAMLADLNETEQTDQELRSPDFDLDVDF